MSNNFHLHSWGFVALMMVVGYNVTYGQFKTIKPNPNSQANNLSNEITIKKSINQDYTRAGDKKLSFTSMSSASLTAISQGLKPGLIGDKNVPIYIEGVLDKLALKGRSVEESAAIYLKTAAPLMKTNVEGHGFVIKNIEKDELGITHVRAQQTYMDVPVYGGEVILHGENNNFDFLNGNYYPAFTLTNVTPTFDSNVALQRSSSDLGESLKYDNELEILAAGSQPQSTLVIYPYEGSFKLAYHVTTYKNLIERWEYFIDAHTGDVVRKYPSICKFHNHKHNHGACAPQEEVLDGKTTAVAQDLFNINRNINTYQVGNKYYLIDASRDMFSQSTSKFPDDPSGVIWTLDALNTSPENKNFNYDHVTTGNNIWNGKNTGVSSHYNAGKSYEYFRIVHNRNAINGGGGNIISFINIVEKDGKPMGNAFWNGSAMFYGNGDGAFLPLARGLDVAGHEMSHGVIQATANLEYEGESGALNESFADIFGTMIDRDDWLIGEDVVRVGAFPSGALRSLSDPHNGAASNDFDNGWQPKTYNERYKGTENNGGVHINSGIPNHAYYLFATAVGKEKAERVFYRALSLYLTKSSKFIDCRIAVIKAATDLYGASDATAAGQAFDKVGILGSSTGGGSYENDATINPGQEFVLTTKTNNQGILIYDDKGTLLGTLSDTDVISKPSVSDNGSEIVFIADDNTMHYITLDWTKNPVQIDEMVLQASPIWRNVIISKDGSKIAALTDDLKNEIVVYHFGNTVTQKTFTLYNPTYTEGVSTGDVNYADAMEFDITGEYIIYDAESSVRSTGSGSITYWDVSFIDVWNNSLSSFSTGQIEKLFSSLPKDVSIGNPTFSKNSPYIISFDYIDEDDNYRVLASNIERGDTKLVFDNNVLGYPNYSVKDQKLTFDNEANNSSFQVGIVDLLANKLEPRAQASLFIGSRRWATWFSNGNRNLTAVNEINAADNSSIQLLNNPVDNIATITFVSNDVSQGTVKVVDVNGNNVYHKNESITVGNNTFLIPTSTLTPGLYNVQVVTQNKAQTVKMIKQ